MKMSATRICVVVLALAAVAAQAERADRDQKATVTAVDAGWEDTPSGDRVYRMEGDIVILQGTLRVTGERGLVKAFANGRMIELLGDGKKQVTFRQKREGENDFVEAWADRGEYDERTDTIQLYSNVRFKSGGDTMKGEYMTYNSVTEKMAIRKSIPGEAPKAATGGSDDRILIEIEPKALVEKKPSVEKQTPGKK